MTFDFIQEIWSAEKKLANRQSLTDSEYQALLQLIHKSYQLFIPKKREVIDTQEANRLLKKSSTEMERSFFNAKIISFEHKYEIAVDSLIHKI